MSLTLTIRAGEPNDEILIGDPSKPIGKIFVISAKGRKVKILFDFPKEIAISRKSIIETTGDR